jgi:hypothetical protein
MEEYSFAESSNSIIRAASSLSFFVIFEILLIDPINSLADLL